MQPLDITSLSSDSLPGMGGRGRTIRARTCHFQLLVRDADALRRNAYCPTIQPRRAIASDGQFLVRRKPESRIQRSGQAAEAAAAGISITTCRPWPFSPDAAK